MPKSQPAIELTGEERLTLAGWAESGEPALALRARIVLAAAGGGTDTEASRVAGVSRNTVAVWRRRFLADRLGAGFHRPSNKSGPVGLGDGQRALLEEWAQGGSDDAALAVKAKLVLLASDGLSLAEASRRLGCRAAAAARWRRLFLEGGPQALVRRQYFAVPFDLDADRRRELEALAAGGNTRLAATCRALVAIADGHGVDAAARQAGLGAEALCQSARLLLEAGPEGLLADPSLEGPARPRIGAVTLDGARRAVLERWAASGGGDGGQGDKMARKARAILMAADGRTVKETVRRVGGTRLTVMRWRRRFVEGGLESLWDRPPRGFEGGVLEGGRLDDARLALLAGWAKGDGAGPALAARAKAVLELAEGRGFAMAIRRSGLSRATVNLWFRRFLAAGPEGLIGGRAYNRVEPIELGASQRGALEGWARGGGGRPGLDARAKAILLLADGATLKEAARQAGVSPGAAASWRRSFLAGGLASLALLRRRGGGPPRGARKAGFELAAGDRAELERWVRGAAADPAMAERAGIVLSGADGLDLAGTARRAGVGLGMAAFWWRRFVSLGLDGLRGVRAGGPDPAAEIAALLKEPSPVHPRPWTAPTVARVLGLGRSGVRAVMVGLGALPERRLTAASFDPGWLARNAAALEASAPPGPFGRWSAGAGALDVPFRQARPGPIDAGDRPGPRGPGGGPPDGDGGG
jgi:transposase